MAMARGHYNLPTLPMPGIPANNCLYSGAKFEGFQCPNPYDDHKFFDMNLCFWYVDTEHQVFHGYKTVIEGPCYRRRVPFHGEIICQEHPFIGRESKYGYSDIQELMWARLGCPLAYLEETMDYDRLKHDNRIFMRLSETNVAIEDLDRMDSYGNVWEPGRLGFVYACLNVHEKEITSLYFHEFYGKQRFLRDFIANFVPERSTGVVQIR